MFAELTDFVSRLTWRRAMAAFVLILVAALLFTLYESMTHAIELGRVERGLALATSAEGFREKLGGTLTEEQQRIYANAMIKRGSTSVFRLKVVSAKTIAHAWRPTCATRI